MEIITDNTQLTVFGGFAPNSQSAEVLSKVLGEQTVQSGYVSLGKDKSRTVQMIGRPLMTVDELKSMPKGQFIVMKTGTHPIISRLRLYFEWGIVFGEPFIHADRGAREVKYMERKALFKAINDKYPIQRSPATSETKSVQKMGDDGAVVFETEYESEGDEDAVIKKPKIKTGGE